MRTNLNARNLELSPQLRAQIDRRLRRLERLLRPDAEIALELRANVSHVADAAQQAEIAVVEHGTVVRSAASAATTLAAVDAVLDKLERQVVRARQRHRPMRGRVLPDPGPEPGPVSPPEPASTRVVKLKRMHMVPMFEEDAILRMNELGHAFFVFLNAETRHVCVVYRRSAGGYGLIEPQVER